MKNNFKIIFFIFAIFFLWINNTQAKWECKIGSDASPLLKEYVKNIKKITWKISSEISWDWWLNNYAGDALNSTFSYYNYQDEIKFHSFFKKFREIPKEVERDYKLLKSLDWDISSLEHKIWEQNASQKKVSGNICAGIENCGFKKGDELWNILRNVAQNHEKIKNIYIKLAVWETDFRKDICENWEITPHWCVFMVKENFLEELDKYYHERNSLVCSEENWLLKTIREKTNNIFKNEEFAKDGIKKWKEAWAKVSGINPVPKEEQKEKEKESLQNRLSKHWVSWDSQKNTLENLEKYSKEWSFSFNNNFFMNSYLQSEKKFKNEFQEIRQEETSEFIEEKKKESDRIENNKITATQKTSDKIKEIEETIRRIYNKWTEDLAIWELKWDNFRTKLIDTHFEIEKSIRILEKTCKMSVKICNQQDSWNWDCWNCNW